MLLLAVLTPPAWGVEDATQRALQQNQLYRQQQQDQLQLKMQQHQNSVRNPAPDVRSRQATERLEIDQALRQQQLQLQQQRELLLRSEAPGDDEGVRRAKAQADQDRARREGRRQLQQFDWELQTKADGERRREEAKALPGAENRGTGLLPPGLPPPTVVPSQ